MSGIKIAEFLLSMQSYIDSNEKYRDASKTSITSGKLTVLNKLGNQELIIPKNKNKKNDIVEINIINNKLQEIKANKQGLIKKLQNAENSIENLGNLLEIQQHGKRKKKWNKEIEDIKTEEIEKKIKKLMLEQAERKCSLEKREKEKLEKIELEEKLKQDEAAKLEAKRLEEKQKLLLEVKEKAEERKKYMEGLKELKALKKKQWLHEKLAEDFKKNVLVPESERIADGSSRKHKTPVPSYDEIQDHIKEYKKLMQSRSLYRHSISYSDSKRFSPSKFLQMITDEENLSKEMEKIKEAEKLDLIDRKKNYANLVRQLYKPIAKEIKSITKPLQEKRRLLSLTPTPKETEKIYIKPKYSPRAVKPKELPKLNYLEERRGLRQKEVEDILNKANLSFDIDLDVDNNALIKARQLEKITKQAEYAVKGYKGGEYNIEAEERINKMLIDSVKAKLEALNNKIA